MYKVRSTYMHSSIGILIVLACIAFFAYMLRNRSERFTQPQSITLVSNVESDNLTYSITSLPARGKLYVNSNGSNQITETTVLTNATIYYMPETGEAGGDSFTYRVFDGDEVVSEPTVNLTMNTVTNSSPITGAGISIGSGSRSANSTGSSSNVTACVDRYGNFVSGLYDKREKKRACRWFSKNCNRQSKCRDEINGLASTDGNPDPFEQLRTECASKPLNAWKTCA